MLCHKCHEPASALRRVRQACADRLCGCWPLAATLQCRAAWLRYAGCSDVELCLQLHASAREADRHPSMTAVVSCAVTQSLPRGRSTFHTLKGTVRVAMFCGCGLPSCAAPVAQPSVVLAAMRCPETSVTFGLVAAHHSQMGAGEFTALTLSNRVRDPSVPLPWKRGWNSSRSAWAFSGRPFHCGTALVECYPLGRHGTWACTPPLKGAAAAHMHERAFTFKAGAAEALPRSKSSCPSVQTFDLLIVGAEAQLFSRTATHPDALFPCSSG